MSKTKRVPENTKPNMAKVRQKIQNTSKCAEEQPNNAVVARNLARLQTKYPQAASAE
jgi:hypothetical protein